MPVQKEHKKWPKATKELGIALSVFAAASILSRGGDMLAWEESIFLWIYGWPEFLGPFFIAVTQFGGFFVLLALAAIYIYRQQYHITLRLLLAGFLAYLASGFAKDLLGRPRPLDLLADLSVRDFIVRGPGYPSGHSALAAAIAVTLWPHLPRRYKWISPFIIIGVGLSRVYLGVHAPLDVVGGIALGWACAELLHHVEIRSRYFGQKTGKHK